MPNSLTSGLPAQPTQPIAAPQAMPQAAPGQAPGQPPQAPQITHQQAVTALRHFSAISRELEQILKDPDLGKSDVQSKIIDGTARLVASRIVTPSDAVQQLSSVPADPQMQRKWVQTHFQQTMVAMNGVLDHHAQSNPGTGDLPVEIARSQSNGADSHLDDMKSLNGGYRSGKRG